MRYWIIILLNLPGFLAEAQRTDLSLAEKLLASEYLIYISASDTAKAALLLEKSEVYAGNSKYQQALAELDRAEKFGGQDNNSLKYAKMFNSFMSGRFDLSASVIIPLAELQKLNKEKEYYSMRFVSLSETGRWDSCRAEMIRYCKDCDSSRVREISSLPSTYSYVDPGKCGKLSAFVPGAGMTKAGKPFKGATSLLIQAGLATFTGYAFFSGYYIAGVVSGVFPLLKFHKGGIRLSAILAEERNEKEKLKLQSQYSEQIKKVVYR